MKHSYPYRKVYLEITNICNRNCSFCPGTKRKPCFISPESFYKMAEKIRPFTEFLYLHLMGEPLLHPQLPRILQICEELSFKVILTTNGTLLSERESLLLSSKAVYKVNISLHSFEANQAENEHYFENCFSFADRASKQGLLCIFRLWNLDSRSAELYGKNSKNRDILLAMQEQLPGEWKEGKRGYRIRPKLHLEWGEIFSWPDYDLAEGRSDHSCYGLRDHFAVLCDGSVVPCCLDREGVMTLGNLLTQELPTILSSKRATRIREGFEKKLAIEPLCRRCGYAERFL